MRRGSWKVEVWEKKEGYFHYILRKRPNSELEAKKLYENIILDNNQRAFLISRGMVLKTRCKVK